MPKTVMIVEDNDLNMKLGIAQRADQGRASAQDRAMGLISGANQAQQSGLQFGNNMMNMGMQSLNPYMASLQTPWNIMGQYSNVIGPPQVLESGSSWTKSSGSSVGGGVGF